MEYSIRRISPGSVFKISFVLYGLLGFFFAFLYGLAFLAISLLGSDMMGPEMEGLVRFGGGFGAIAVFFGGLALAVTYAALSAAITSVLAVVYNLLAGWIGGFRVVLDPRWAERTVGSPGPAEPHPAAPPIPPQSPPPGPSQPLQAAGPQDQARERGDPQDVSKPEERPGETRAIGPPDRDQEREQNDQGREDAR